MGYSGQVTAFGVYPAGQMSRVSTSVRRTNAGGLKFVAHSFGSLGLRITAASCLAYPYLPNLVCRPNQHTRCKT